MSPAKVAAATCIHSERFDLPLTLLIVSTTMDFVPGMADAKAFLYKSGKINISSGKII